MGVNPRIPRLRVGLPRITKRAWKYTLMRTEPFLTPMIARRHFCLAAAAVLLPQRLLCGAPGPTEKPTSRRAFSPAKTAAIRSHADGLLARAVRSTFGWGWADEERGIDLTHGRVPKGKAYNVDAILTVRIGLLLDLAGRLLEEK